jgi:antitoxin VapB
MPKIVTHKEPPASKTKLFQNNNARGVRLAKAVDFAESVEHVTVLKYGRGRLVLPSSESWEAFFESPGLNLPDSD